MKNKQQRYSIIINSSVIKFMDVLLINHSCEELCTGCYSCEHLACLYAGKINFNKTKVLNLLCQKCFDFANTKNDVYSTYYKYNVNVIGNIKCEECYYPQEDTFWN